MALSKTGSKMQLQSKECTYDVVIVGAGPAGLVAAAWMTAAGVKTLLIDKSPAPPPCGRADGLESRTFEILENFKLGESIWKEANQTVKVSLWSHSTNGIRRILTRQNSPEENSYYSQYAEATLAQGRIESHLLNFIRSRGTVEVLRNHAPCALDITQDGHGGKQTHPVQLDLSLHDKSSIHHNHVPLLKDSTSRTVQCQYLLACDGAHSWVRKQLGLKMEGEATDDHWGVIDCVPITNFPDIRMRCIMQSASCSIMIIPREKQLVRFYVQLSQDCRHLCEAEQRKVILTSITRMLNPYWFRTDVIDWISLYSIGQRLCETYSAHERVFLAGDAVHTHSPKAGQGMNTSMQDTFNLGWKIASVVKGLMSDQILNTYPLERMPVARRLLGFDREIYSAISGKVSNNGQDALISALEKENSAASGLAVAYDPNLLVSKFRDISTPEAASSLRAGMRLPDLPVTNYSDGHICHLHDLLHNGQWALIILGGDIGNPVQLDRLHNFAAELSRHPFEPRTASNDLFGAVRPTLIHCTRTQDISIHSLPRIFAPFDESMGFDYTRVFSEEQNVVRGSTTVYREFGMSQDGGIIMVRPDHHIAFIGNLGDVGPLKSFISEFRIGPCPLI